MPVSDLLTRLGAFFIILSSLWNGLVSLLYIATLIWVLVGVLWFVPLVLAVLNALFAMALMIFGHNKVSGVGPLVGMFVSICNFNVFGLMIDMAALGLMIGGYVSRANEDRSAHRA